MEQDINEKELLFAWLTIRYKTKMWISIIELPILMALWYLNYNVGFWVWLVLIILSDIGSASWIQKVERKLGIDV